LFAQETEILLEWMSPYGICDFFTIRGETTEVRVGFFTQILEEVENVQRYGQVIFFDTTDVASSLR
jgi:hypothetical protein